LHLFSDVIGIGIGEALFAGVLGIVCVWAIHRLTVVGNAALALWRTPTAEATQLKDGQPIAVEGRVFVDEPAALADRLFDPTVGTVGAYIWRAWFQDTGRYTYDFDRGELRRGRNTFASGFESGRWGVTSDGADMYIDLSWLEQVYDPEALSDLEVGNPASNAKLPTIVTRHVWDAIYLSLNSIVDDCSIDRLTDIVDLYRDDVAADEFHIESRGITAGQDLFICGELCVQAGESSIIGTGKTPLLISDDGQEGLKQRLLWRGIKYSVVLIAALGLAALFIL
jgi:hypothetical protein